MKGGTAAEVRKTVHLVSSFLFKSSDLSVCILVLMESKQRFNNVENKKKKKRKQENTKMSRRQQMILSSPWSEKKVSNGKKNNIYIIIIILITIYIYIYVYVCFFFFLEGKMDVWMCLSMYF